VQALAGEVTPLVAARRYTEALVQLAGLREVVDRFFDEVLVMDEDPALRENRLSLVRRIADLPRYVADMSRLEGF